jgi:tetratricopeptide (TPR) repeat protein
MNSNGLAVVPVIVFVDEHGIIRNARPKINQLSSFVEKKYLAPPKEAETISQNEITPEALRDEIAKAATANAWCALGDSLLNWGDKTDATDSINSYQQAIKIVRNSSSDRKRVTLGQLYFRLGVAHRSRFDNPPDADASEDFAEASKFWSRALAENPNQYIWRRRIQQYGPRLTKPYPFYDWVDQAVSEISARGESAVQLKVSLTGAEIAQPQKKFAESKKSGENPDADSRITIDSENYIGVKATTVPAWVQPGEAARVHLRFLPNQGKWNNEAEPLRIWIEKSSEYTLTSQLLEIPNGADATSVEPRVAEFEVFVDKRATKPIRIRGFALYNTCASDDSQCLFRRLEFEVPLKIRRTKSGNGR